MKKIFLQILFILILLYSYSQEKEIALTVDEAVNLALRNNLDYKVEGLNFDEKKWALYTTWNIFIPTVTMSVSLTKINQSILDDAKDNIIESIKKSTEEQYGFTPTTDQVLNDEPYKSIYKENWDNVTKGIVSTSLNLNFNFNIAMIFSVYQNVLNYQNGKISFDMAKKNLINQTKNLYYSLILQNSNIGIKKQILEASQKRYELAVKKFEVDLISQLEKLNAEYAYEKLIPELDEKIIDYDDNLLTFKNMLGIKKDVEVILVSNFEEEKVELIDSTNMIDKYLKNNHELKIMGFNLRSLQNKRNNYISLLTPSISLSFLIDPTYQKTDPFNKDVYWFSDIDEDWKEKNGSFTFAVSIPIDYYFPFSVMQMNLVNNEMAVKKYKYQIEDKRLEKEQRVIYLTKKINQVYNSLKSLELNLALSEKSFHLTELSYKAGLKLLYELLDAEKDVEDAKLALLNAKYNYIINLNNLEYELNTDLHGLNK